MRQLYPAIEAYREDYLRVSDLHTLYYEESGNPQGIPVVYLHGGPGVGTKPLFRQFFDPDRFRGILFSQRGASRSLPLGELRQNDTWELVEDLEKLRKALKIEKWFVFGGSWGSTLALVYAIQHPDKVRGLVLRGIFLGRQQELDWIYKNGASNIYPDKWENFRAMIPLNEQSDLVKAYSKRLNSKEPVIQLEYSKAWCAWEDDIIRLIPTAPAPTTDEDLIAFAQIECHYMLNQLFFPHDNYILDNVHKIRHIPCWIAQGRYDVICPAMSAFDLKRVLPDAQLNIIQDAGHSSTEPGITSSLIEGLEELAHKH